MPLQNTLAAIVERLKAIQKVLSDLTHTISTAEERNREQQQHPTEIRGEIWVSKEIEAKRSTEQGKQYATQKWIARGTWAATLAATIYAGIAAKQLVEMRNATAAATKSADTAAKEFEVSQRPWVKIGHKIVSPLTFGVERNGGPMAIMTIRDIIENVGQTVAVDVVSWEDIIPMGPNLSINAAESRQSQWCDANRYPQTSSFLSGRVIFPKDPRVQDSTVGASMDAVMKAAANSPKELTGKVSFVLVGCVCYRAAFEEKTVPMHQTRFLYYLGAPQDGGWYPWVTPTGIANGLNVIDVGKFSAD